MYLNFSSLPPIFFHQGFCNTEADKRKMRGGSKVRREKEMKQLVETFAVLEAAGVSDEEKNCLKEAADICQKKSEEKYVGKV